MTSLITLCGFFMVHRTHPHLFDAKHHVCSLRLISADGENVERCLRIAGMLKPPIPQCSGRMIRIVRFSSSIATEANWRRLTLVGRRRPRLRPGRDRGRGTGFRRACDHGSSRLSRSTPDSSRPASAVFAVSSVPLSHAIMPAAFFLRGRYCPVDGGCGGDAVAGLPPSSRPG